MTDAGTLERPMRWRGRVTRIDGRQAVGAIFSGRAGTAHLANNVRTARAALADAAEQRR